MNWMFRRCSSLDIYKWNTFIVTDMNGMFYNCLLSLISLLDIFKWDTNNITDIT